VSCRPTHYADEPETEPVERPEPVAPEPARRPVPAGADRPDPGRYDCCGRRVADGHPLMCAPQIAATVILVVLVVCAGAMLLVAAA
jgi:hypothetical protein